MGKDWCSNHPSTFYGGGGTLCPTRKWEMFPPPDKKRAMSLALEFYFVQVDNLTWGEYSSSHPLFLSLRDFSLLVKARFPPSDSSCSSQPSSFEPTIHRDFSWGLPIFVMRSTISPQFSSHHVLSLSLSRLLSLCLSVALVLSFFDSVVLLGWEKPWIIACTDPGQ